MKKKIYIIILLIVVSCALFVLPASYSLYQEQVNLEVITRTGELICDVKVETSDDYIENNEVFFYIYVYNYKEDNGTTVLTSADVTYDLTISNKDGSNAYYRFVSDDGSTNETGQQTAVIGNQQLGKNEKSQRQYKVYVTTDSDSKVDVNFNVNLNARQSVME